MSKKKTNRIIIDGDSAFVHLRQGYIAIVDAADVEQIQQHCWHARVERRRDTSIRAVYVNTRIRRSDGKQTGLALHRLLTGAVNGIEVDHRDGDGLNNSRANLRLCTCAENMRNQRLRSDNTTGLKGVQWRGDLQRWRVRIGLDGKRKHLGYFNTREEAALAYNASANETHGEFARLNLINPSKAVARETTA